MKVNVYNLKGIVERYDAGYELYSYVYETFTIIPGSDGWYLAYCYEGVGSIYRATDTVEIPLAKKRNDNSIAVVPEATLKVPMQELIDEFLPGEKREIEFVDTIRKFGARLERNFLIQWRALKDIGLNPTDFHATGFRD